VLKKFFPPKAAPKPAVSGTDRQYALDCIPIRNPECEENQEAEGVLLRYPVQAKPWLRKIFKTATTREPEIIIRKLQLDSMGSSVWKMIDGNTSVQQISLKFQEQHKLNPREAEISVSEFVQQLGRRGLVALKEPEGG